MVAQANANHKPLSLAELAGQLEHLVRQAAHEGQAVHHVELQIWRQLLALGRAALGQFFDLQGQGDLGETLTLPDGSDCRRLDHPHPRRYVSLFGAFTLQRVVYGTREGQKIDFVPLDARLQLPASDFSYVLQDWDQALCVEQAFNQAAGTVARMLGLEQSVDSLERMNTQMAADVTAFRENRPKPDPTTEGEVMVVSADGKGVVLRRAADDPAPAAHRTKGEKASKKRMATVGTVYTVDRYQRSPADVVAALFRDAPRPREAARPQPQHKRVWAGLPQVDEEGQWQSGLEVVYPWLLNEVAERNPGLRKEMVYIHDGQEALWEACAAHLPGKNATEVLDLLHVTPRLWQAAHLFEREKSAAAEAFVRRHLLAVLQGKVGSVIRGLRRRGTRRGLRGAKQKALRQLCGYLEKNKERMDYGRYLEKGYPIASGVIEGACRHLVKDRMERAGMHWREAGAQAMLDLRSTFINGDWQEYQDFRIERETNRLYPQRSLVEGVQYCLPA